MRVIHARKPVVQEHIPLENSVNIQPKVKKRQKVQDTPEYFLKQPIDFLSMASNNLPKTPVNDEDSDYTTPLSAVFGTKNFKPITPMDNNGMDEIREMLEDMKPKKDNVKHIFRLTTGIEKEPIFRVTPEISLQKISVGRVLQLADKSQSLDEKRTQQFARHFPVNLLQGPNIIRRSQLAMKNKVNLTFT